MDPDYFDIAAEERMMGLNGFYDPSDEDYEDYEDEDYEDEDEE